MLNTSRSSFIARVGLRGLIAVGGLAVGALVAGQPRPVDPIPPELPDAAGAAIATVEEAATASAGAVRGGATPTTVPGGGTPTTAPSGDLVGGSPAAGWIIACPYSHTLKDDPILKPGQPGMSHSHDFLGGRDTNANSTIESMRTGGTTCALPQDTAAYWVPTLYRDGIAVHPFNGVLTNTGEDSSQHIYYRNPNGVRVQPIPAGLRIIVGNPVARSAAENPLLGHQIWFGCGGNEIADKLTSPPTRCSDGLMTLHVHFPNCWDGVNLDSADHISHMAWPRNDRCPASHPVTIPRVTIRTEYVVNDPVGTITFASGAPFTVHGDFWNTWQQDHLEELIERCINAGVDCKKFR